MKQLWHMIERYYPWLLLLLGVDCFCAVILSTRRISLMPFAVPTTGRCSPIADKITSLTRSTTERRANENIFSPTRSFIAARVTGFRLDSKQ